MGVRVAAFERGIPRLRLRDARHNRVRRLRPREALCYEYEPTQKAEPVPAQATHDADLRHLATGGPRLACLRCHRGRCGEPSRTGGPRLPAHDAGVLAVLELDQPRAPEHTLVIEDSGSGISAGRYAGAKVLAIATTKPVEYLRTKTGANLVAENFKDAAQILQPYLPS